MAKRLKKPAVPSFNHKGNIVQHEFNLNLIEDMEVLIHLIQKGSISRATKAVKIYDTRSLGKKQTYKNCRQNLLQVR